MKKRFVAAIMMITLTFVLTACGKSDEVLAVEHAISDIGTVTLHSTDSINNAQTMYNQLMESERKKVSNYQDLVDAIATLSQMEEAYYQDCYDVAVSKMLDTLILAEEICNTTQSIWHNSIWQIDDENTNQYTKDPAGVFYSDFNDALINFYRSNEYQDKADMIKSNAADIERLIETLKEPPEKFKGNMLDAIVSYYVEYQKFIDLALYPNESLNSFSEKFEQIDQTSIDAYRKAAFYTSVH